MDVESYIKEDDLNNKYKSLFFENYSLLEIIKNVEDGIFLDNLVTEKKNDKLIVYNKDDYEKYCMIFYKPVIANYSFKTYLGNKILETEKIISTIEINQKLSNYDIKNVSFSYDDEPKKYNYECEIIELEDISFHKINIEINAAAEYIYIRDDIIIMKNENINANELSIYFDKYFNDYPYGKLDFFMGENRSKLIKLLKFFTKNPYVNFLKICGPSHNGKSITLLKFSRQYSNIVYFNLKTLVNSKSSDIDEISFYSIIFYELNRIKLDNAEANDLVKFFKDRKCLTPSELIYKVIEHFINKKVIFILDQFKASNFDSSLYSKIEEIVLNSKVKIILCSSIDEGPIRNELIHSLKINRGNPKNLTKETQKYYFYFSCLFDYNLLIKLYNENEYDKNELKIYKKFNYNLKYKNLLDKAEDKNQKLERISEDIKNKIKKNFNQDSEQIFFKLSSKIGKELFYDNSDDFESLFFLPFKYYYLTLNENYFIINYNFPFIQEIAMKWPKEKDIENYFLNKKYTDEFYTRFKGDYFEDYVKIFINNKKDVLFPNNINNYLLVENIVNMDDLDEDNFKSNKKNIISTKNIDNSNDEKKYNERIKTLIENEIDTIPEKKDYKDINYFYKFSLEEKLNNKSFLGKKRKQINEYSEEFKNDGIIINQKNRNGETLDEAILYGTKNKKIFIGLQMKFYAQKTKIDKKDEIKFEKNYIKNKLKNILSTTKINFDMSISEWHYFMIICYISDDEEYKYGKSLVKICKKYNLEYLFFEPKTKSLYNSKFEKIEKINTTNKSNLDLDINFNPYLVFQNFWKLDKNVINSDIFKIYDFTSNEFLLEIQNLTKEIIKNDISVFVRKLENIIKIKKIKIIGIMNCEFILMPKKNYGYFVLSEDKNILICYNTNNFIIYYDYLNDKKIEQDEFFKKKNDSKLYILQCCYYDNNE